jgi:hypothetical protein
LSLSQHYHADATAFHRLPGADLCGLSALGLTIHHDQPIGDHLLALCTACGNAGQFEQVAYPDVLAVQLKLDGFHGVPEGWARMCAGRQFWRNGSETL